MCVRGWVGENKDKYIMSMGAVQRDWFVQTFRDLIFPDKVRADEDLKVPVDAFGREIDDVLDEHTDMKDLETKLCQKIDEWCHFCSMECKDVLSLMNMLHLAKLPPLPMSLDETSPEELCILGVISL